MSGIHTSEGQQSPGFELFVENRLTSDGANHLLEVGHFETHLEVARAAYAHMNGPVTRADERLEQTFATSARRIAEMTGSENSIFHGLSESGDPYTFYLEPVDGSPQ